MSQKPLSLFLSYRRADAKTPLSELHKKLARVYGQGAIFLDTSMMRGGDVFPEVLREKIREADVVLVVIGAHWSRPRNEGKTDWVVEEITHALKYEKKIIPVLVEDASFPPRNLPEAIKDLAKRHCVTLRPQNFAADLHELLSVLPKKPEATRITSGTIGQLRVAQTIQPHQDRVSQVLWSADGKLIVSASDDGSVAWWRRGRVRSRPGHEQAIGCIALNANQKELLSLSADRLRVWDTNAELVKETPLKFDKRRLPVFAASSRDPIFVVAPIASDPEVYITPSAASDGKFGRTFVGMPSRFATTKMAFSLDGIVFVAGAGDGDVAAWLVDGRRVLWVKHARRSVITAIAISGEGEFVAAAQEGLISVRQIADGSELFSQATTLKVTSLAFLPGGEILVCGNEEGPPLFLHLPSRTTLPTPASVAHAISCVAASLDGNSLAAGTLKGEVQQWNID